MKHPLDVRIREARLDDAAGIVAVLNPIIVAGGLTVIDGPLTVEDQRAYMEAYPSRGLFLVAEIGEPARIVGLQSVEPFDASSRHFDHAGTIGTFIELGLRGRGIGKLLAAETFRRLPAKGYEKLATYVLAENRAALAFYRQLGFEVVGTLRRQARFGPRYLDEVLIERFL